MTNEESARAESRAVEAGAVAAEAGESQPVAGASQAGASPAGASAGARRSLARTALLLVREVVVVVVIALAVSLAAKTFLVQAFFIPSQSMENTLKKGDRVLVTKLTPGPFALHHGDVVVFLDPGHWLEEEPPKPKPGVAKKVLTFVGLLPEESKNHLIKRLIGLPGDRVECCDVKGRLSVNDVPLNEPYLRPGEVPSQKKFAVTVPKDNLWVMGDNRSNSEDSRFKGTVPMSKVTGRAFSLVWPFDRATWLSNYSPTFAKVPENSP